MKLLLADARVDPEAESNYAVIEARKKGFVEIVAVLEADIARRREVREAAAKVAAEAKQADEAARKDAKDRKRRERREARKEKDEGRSKSATGMPPNPLSLLFC